MILVTVGTQLPFDRMVGMVDRWAACHSGVEVVAQIGPSTARFAHLRTMDFVPPSESSALVARAEVIVSHAGMGSILTALKLRRPIIIVPRVASLGEHRNEHQLATARWLSGRPGIFVATDEQSLSKLLDRRSQLGTQGKFSDYADDALLSALREFIQQG